MDTEVHGLAWYANGLHATKSREKKQSFLSIYALHNTPAVVVFSPASSCLLNIHTLVLSSTFRMGKWPVAFLLLVALLQVPDVLSRSAGKAAVPAQKLAKVEASTGFQGALTGLSS